MSRHGFDELTGEVSDTEKLKAVLRVLDGQDPCNLKDKRRRDYTNAAREIAEQCEGNSIPPHISRIELVVQLALYRAWGREWLDGRDIGLARLVSNVYWPSLEKQSSGPASEIK